MAERQRESDSPEYEETVDPNNPPAFLLRRDVRRAVFWSYLGPLLVLCSLAAVGLIYWSTRPSPSGDVSEMVGTAGDRQTPGGAEPGKVPGSTRDELERRGAGSPPQGPAAATRLTELTAMVEADPRTIVGRRIEVRGVSVVQAPDNAMFWIQDGPARAAVVAPPRAPAVRAGSRVNVSGVVESDGQGGVRIRATHVEAR